MLSLLAVSASSANKWAVVTGGSSGIGRAIALEASSRGYSVVIAARRETVLNELAEEIRSKHAVETLAVAVDLSTGAGATKLHQATAHLPITILFANAGFSSIGQYVEMPSQEIEQMAAVNMVAVAALCRLYGASLPSGGSIVITSSLTAYAPLPGATLYAATRAFVHSLAGGLSAELRPRNVRVRCLLPGATDTEFAATSNLDNSLAFTGPFFRPLGIVTKASAVAVAALDSVGYAAHVVDVIPSFMQRAYALAARALMPRALASAFAGHFFGEVSPLSSRSSLSDFLNALPVLLPAAVAIVVALPLVLLQDMTEALPPPLGYMLGLLYISLVARYVSGSRSTRRSSDGAPPAAARAKKA